MTFYLIAVVAFVLGWILRGSLCARRGGCDALANDEIERLEAQVEILSLERMAR